MEGRIIAERYRLQHSVGKGAMGSVWRAEHLALGTPVAVKLIDAEAARIPEAVGRFQREAQIAARIRSAHVVRMLDHGYDQGLPFIVMEWLEGQSLRDRLDQQPRLTVDETARLLAHVCRALGQAHELGLVHRDVKPENIFAVPGEDDSGDIYKVLDFGVAKVTDGLNVAQVGPTKTGALLGTPYYVSPEQARGLKTVDHRADLWSVGVLCYECLTGERPFRAAALPPLLVQVVEAPVVPPSQQAPDAQLPAGVDDWMAQALSRDPDDRFASARVLASTFRIAVGLADTPSEAGRELDDAETGEAATQAIRLPGGTPTSPGLGPSAAAALAATEADAAAAPTLDLVEAARAVGVAAGIAPGVDSAPVTIPKPEESWSAADTAQMARSPVADGYDEAAGAPAPTPHPAMEHASYRGAPPAGTPPGVESWAQASWPAQAVRRTGPSPYIGVVVIVVVVVALGGGLALWLGLRAAADDPPPSETTEQAAEPSPSADPAATSDSVGGEVDSETGDDGAGGSPAEPATASGEPPEATDPDPPPPKEQPKTPAKPTAPAAKTAAPKPKPTATKKAGDWSHRKTLD